MRTAADYDAFCLVTAPVPRVVPPSACSPQLGVSLFILSLSLCESESSPLLPASALPSSLPFRVCSWWCHCPLPTAKCPSFCVAQCHCCQLPLLAGLTPCAQVSRIPPARRRSFTRSLPGEANPSRLFLVRVVSSCVVSCARVLVTLAPCPAVALSAHCVPAQLSRS